MVMFRLWMVGVKLCWVKFVLIVPLKQRLFFVVQWRTSFHFEIVCFWCWKQRKICSVLGVLNGNQTSILFSIFYFIRKEHSKIHKYTSAHTLTPESSTNQHSVDRQRQMCCPIYPLNLIVTDINNSSEGTHPHWGAKSYNCDCKYISCEAVSEESMFTAPQSACNPALTFELVYGSSPAHPGKQHQSYERT